MAGRYREYARKLQEAVRESQKRKKGFREKRQAAMYEYHQELKNKKKDQSE